MNLFSGYLIRGKLRYLVFLLLNLVILTVSVSAYTIDNEPNLNRKYTWQWNDGVTGAASYFLVDNPLGNPPVRKMHLTASMVGFGNKVYQNGGVNYSSLSAYDVVSVDGAEQNPIVIYASESTPLQTFEYPFVMLNVSTGRDDYLLISHDFTFVVDFITVGFEDGYEISPLFNFNFSYYSKLYLSLNGEVKYSLDCSYQGVEPITSSQGENLYKYTCFFVMDNFDGVDIEFDEIDVQFPVAVNLGPGVKTNGVWSSQYYSRYRVSISDAYLYETADPNTVNIYDGVSAANDKMLLELGTINTVDQAKLQQYDYSKLLTDGIIDIYQSKEQQIFDSFQDINLSTSDYVENLSSSSNSLWEVFFGADETQLTTFNVFLRDLMLITVVLVGSSVILFSMSSLAVSAIKNFRSNNYRNYNFRNRKR